MRDTINLHLTAPLIVALFGPVEQDPSISEVVDPFAVIASKLTCKSLLVNKSRGTSGADGCDIGRVSFTDFIVEGKLFSL